MRDGCRKHANRLIEFISKRKYNKSGWEGIDRLVEGGSEREVCKLGRK